MSWEWANILVCPYCGGEVAEKMRKENKTLYYCLAKRCGWKGTSPGEIHGRVIR